MKAGIVFASIFLFAVYSFAVTSQFRGVNWADKRDNFVSDVLVLSGMSLSDNYESASVVAERVIGQFQEVLGTNSVRVPVNEPTILTNFDVYSGALDVALKHGRLVMGYWGPAQPSGPKNMDDWWKMWARLVEKYGEHPNAYFEIFNEPHMYSKDELRNLYVTWLEKFPNVSRDHILLDGSGLAWNVPDIADDPRFEGCLFAVHEYTFWNMSITTEEGWKQSFQGKVGKYVDRTVCTEWGGAMGPGEKNGVHYDYMDYNQPPNNYFTAYIRGMSDQLREWEMGSFYWPGLRDGDWYSMTKRVGEGANIKLEVVNQSGLDRMQRAWADTVVIEQPKDTSVTDSASSDTATADTSAKVSATVPGTDSLVVATPGIATDSAGKPVASTDSSVLADSSAALHGNARWQRVSSGTLQVFSMTGRFLGRVDSRTGAVADISASLKNAGYAPGVYWVRGAGLNARIRIK